MQIYAGGKLFICWLAWEWYWMGPLYSNFLMVCLFKFIADRCYLMYSWVSLNASFHVCLMSMSKFSKCRCKAAKAISKLFLRSSAGPSFGGWKVGTSLNGFLHIDHHSCVLLCQTAPTLQTDCLFPYHPNLNLILIRHLNQQLLKFESDKSALWAQLSYFS